ncbi:hypothetical protein [Mycobacteroides abscessus]|uniref:hypothetical protein n=2 Tax=Mycobacteroides abscessus TaxID=36809 RepID=UPI00037242CB|nr:hypothetical protein [Mycobacteroides abscessus]
MREQAVAGEAAADAARSEVLPATAYGFVATVHRPGLPQLHLGFMSAFGAQQACRSLTADLVNTAHVPGTTISWSERPEGVVPLAPVVVEPVALGKMIAAEASARPDGRSFPDLYNRLAAQEGQEAAGRVWGAACRWLDDDGTDLIAQ